MSNNFIQMNLCDIKQKLNNKRAIIEFFMESGYYYPPFSSFNYQFCIQVLNGSKKVLIIIFYFILFVAFKTRRSRWL